MIHPSSIADIVFDSDYSTPVLVVHRPEVLESKVETMFRELGWKIIWTPPYAPKYQPIELVWGFGKQRAGTFYTKSRTLLDTRTYFRWGWYGVMGRYDNMKVCSL